MASVAAGATKPIFLLLTKGSEKPQKKLIQEQIFYNPRTDPSGHYTLSARLPIDDSWLGMWPEKAAQQRPSGITFIEDWVYP